MLENKALQELKGKTVEIKLEGIGLQYIGILQDYNDKAIILKPSVTIEALPGAYGSNESLTEYRHGLRRNLLALISRPIKGIMESQDYS
jgi:hypothetical protein